MTAPSRFEIETRTTDREVRVLARGEIDIAVQEPFREEVLSVLGRAEGRTVVVDLGGVSFMDSSGLRAVLQTRDAAGSAGVSFRLAVGEPVGRLLDAAGVRDWFQYE